MAPDRASLSLGCSALALAAVSGVPWARVVARLSGGPVTRSWAEPFFAIVSLIGFCLAIGGMWFAAKSWLREDVMTVAAWLGFLLGLATIFYVVSLGPCGPPGCVLR